MPMYDFQCRLCKHTFEVLLSVKQFTTEKTRTKCPICKEGCDHLMSVPVPIGTNTRFSSRYGTLADQFGDTPSGRRHLKQRVAAAKRAGYTPNMNDVYDPTVATSMGAPEGFIPADDPNGHLNRVMAKRGLKRQDGVCVPVETVSSKPPKRVPLAEDIVQDLIEKRIKQDPGLAANKAKLREEIIDKHSYRRR